MSKLVGRPGTAITNVAPSAGGAAVVVVSSPPGAAVVVVSSPAGAAVVVAAALVVVVSSASSLQAEATRARPNRITDRCRRLRDGRDRWRGRFGCTCPPSIRSCSKRPRQMSTIRTLARSLLIEHTVERVTASNASRLIRLVVGGLGDAESHSRGVGGDRRLAGDGRPRQPEQRSAHGNGAFDRIDPHRPSSVDGESLQLGGEDRHRRDTQATGGCDVAHTARRAGASVACRDHDRPVDGGHRRSPGFGTRGVDPMAPAHTFCPDRSIPPTD